MKKASKTPTFPSTASTGKTVFIGIALILSIVTILLAGCASLPSTPPGGTFSPPRFDPSKASADLGSYDEVYQALASAFEKQGRMYGGIENAMAEDRAAPTAGSEGFGEAISAQSAKGAYSETNVQVKGIDEGDVIKTDGKHIYLVAGLDVVVIEADGTDTREIARITVNDDALNKNDDSMIYPQELYVDGDTLIILYSYGIYDPVEEEDKRSDSSSYYYPPYNYRSVTEVACYDISDPQDPRLINTFGQDGYCVSSRLQEGVLYLISNYGVYDFSVLERESPITYVPLCYTGTDRELLDYTDICILPERDSTSYSIITSLDVSRAQRIDQYSVLGASNTLYMSYDNLYLASGVFDKVEENSYQDGSFTVVEYQETYSTRVSKLSLDQGTIGFVADALLPGMILNQFALDEYEGHLRMVTTVNSNRYRTLDDGKGIINDYQSYTSEPTTNALFILDAQLRTSGSIEGLAEDEQVYSVRFDGAVGYFVTFRQVDPLFAVDLSDPRSPRIKGELKIPGFSTYLHVYDTDRLFGLGMSADDRGRTQGLKMSMFDTADPYDISERHLLGLGESTYSDALYNHKAIIIDREKNLIGFPVENGYAVYGYSDEEGFYLRQSLKAPEDVYYSNQRGLYVGDYFYICAQGNIGVYTLKDLAPVTQVPIEVNEADYVVKPYAVR